jgi:hypothetical protein
MRKRKPYGPRMKPDIPAWPPGRKIEAHLGAREKFLIMRLRTGAELSEADRNYLIALIKEKLKVPRHIERERAAVAYFNWMNYQLRTGIVDKIRNQQDLIAEVEKRYGVKRAALFAARKKYPPPKEGPPPRVRRSPI